MLSRVEVYEQIRRDRRMDPQVSIRTLAVRYRVHRRDVRRALSSAVPPARKAPPPRATLIDPVKPAIDAMLREDLVAPRKQRHTAQRIFTRLAVEHGFTAASYSTVLNYVNERRREIAEDERERRRHLEGFVPQQHAPSAEAEVDFAEVWVRLAGEPVQCALFTLRLSFSGKAIHRVYASQGQEAFMEGHIEAFRALGGVPTRHIRYDNLKPAVKYVCFGRNRVESSRWVAFRSHYMFDAFYCLPGVEGAHEKGGVEQEGGRFRRNHLVPVPEVDTLAELNERIARIEAQEDARHIADRPTSVGFDFAQEAPLLAPLPGEDFEPGTSLAPTVRRNGRITVRQSYYSVPARFIGRTVRVSLRANELLIFDRGQVVARHPRQTRRGAFRDSLDHYLEILLVKPGALAGATALAQARAQGSFTAVHEAFWAAARQCHGEAAGTRALIEVLLLHRLLPAHAVITGMRAALEAGSTSPELVAIEARKTDPAGSLTAVPSRATLGEGEQAGEGDAAGQDPGAKVITLHPRRTDLPADTRPLPSVAVYDQLLTRRSKGSA